MSEITIHKGSEFPNGSSYMFFDEVFCCRCNRYVLDDDGMFAAFPEDGGCEIRDKIERAGGGEPVFPGEDVVEIWENNMPKYWHVCRGFVTDDEKVMDQYRALFGRTYGESCA